MGRSFSFDRGRGGKGLPQGVAGKSLEDSSNGASGFPPSQQGKNPGESSGDFLRNPLSNPMFFKMLPNGDFESEAYEDEKDWEPDDDQEDMESSEAGCLLEKREAESEGPRGLIEDGSSKKGRFEASEETNLS